MTTTTIDQLMTGSRSWQPTTPQPRDVMYITHSRRLQALRNHDHPYKQQGRS